MDLLKRFEERNRFAKLEKLDEEDVELSLGLSSNGRFGAEPPRAVANGGCDDNNDNNNNKDDNRGLIRASSVSDLWNCSPETEDQMSLRLCSPITRTCSLPTQTEVELRKRKELQSLRRSEAKRKRVEKLKNGRGVKELLPEDNELRQSSPSSSLLPPLPRPASAGSPASGGSSGVSDLESQPFSGCNKDYEPNRAGSSSLCRSNSTASQTSSQTIINGNRSNETLKKLFADMPCVSTKEGVNGKKIQGFLYRYSKDEEVRIVCVCHGSFLTPAEFVKHGGGGEVEHPLRHIVVMPPSL